MVCYYFEIKSKSRQVSEVDFLIFDRQRNNTLKMPRESCFSSFIQFGLFDASIYILVL